MKQLIFLLLLGLLLITGCAEKTKTLGPQQGPDKSSTAPKEEAALTENQAFAKVQELGAKDYLPVYKPTYTAGYEFDHLDIAETYHPVVVYRKGELTISIFNNSILNREDSTLKVSGTVNGFPYTVSDDGAYAEWTESHKTKNGIITFKYGVEQQFSASSAVQPLAKEELIKILKSMKPFKTSTLTEEQAYAKLTEKFSKNGLPVYKPTYTAGYSFDRLALDGEPHVIYRKGDSTFAIINNLVGDLGDVMVESIGTINGYPAIIQTDGLIAKWDEEHTVNKVTSIYSYGVELGQNNGAPPKEEVVKIIKSMEKVRDF